MSQLHELAASPNNPENIQQNMTILWNQLQAIKAQRSKESGKAEVWRTVREHDTAMIAKVNYILFFVFSSGSIIIKTIISNRFWKMNKRVLCMLLVY